MTSAQPQTDLGPKALRDAILHGTPYASYVYSYPHKTAYRPFEAPLALEDVWSDEDTEALFLYMHVPFCEMRCGFCNLFTTVKPGGDIMEDYVDAVRRQALKVRRALGDDARFARAAIGGGTPTFLSTSALARLLDVADEVMGAPLEAIPMSVEMSPETATPDKLRLLRSRGADRASIGVQSFLDNEVDAINRRQRLEVVRGAIETMREAGFPTINLDLMYGLPGQTDATWQHSLDAALAFEPEEIYLYPLYVRPLTRMGASAKEWDDERLALYRAGRDKLLSEGYTQVSMRMFRASDAPEAGGPAYRCQQDGMVGLGCGARSYTDDLHYSSAYAVGPKDVKSIIGRFIAQTDAAMGQAHYGHRLSDEDKRRRHAILSILSEEGLDRSAYAARFGTELDADLPELAALSGLGFAEDDGAVLRLTAEGMARSDAIGPWLFSDRINLLMTDYEAR